MFRTAFSLDRAHANFTVLSSLLVVVTLVLAAVFLPHDGRLPVIALVLGALALSWMMGPSALVVEGAELRIERRAWRPLRVALSSVESAAPVSELGRRRVRVLGVGGFFGSYGLFASDKLGRFRLYSTRCGQAVIIRRNDGSLPIVVTPDDVAGTIAAIDQRPIVRF